MIQGRSDSSQSLAALPQAADLIQHGLLGGVGFDVPPVGAQPVAEPDVAHALAVTALVAHRVPRSFANGLALQLGNRRHDVQDQAASGEAGVQ